MMFCEFYKKVMIFLRTKCKKNICVRGDVAALDVVEFWRLGGTFVAEEVAGESLKGHFARHELVEGVERYVL